MKRYGVVLFVCLCVLTVSAFAAEFRYGVRAGTYFDPTDPFVGFELVMPITGSFVFNPSFEAIFADNGENEDTTLALNADLAYNFANSGSTTVFAGAGVAGFLEDDEFDGGVNLLGGVSFTTGTLEPYAMGKFVIADEDNRAAVGVGVRF